MIMPELNYPPFSPPRWLRNPHVQTVVASRKPRRWTYGWNTWESMRIDLGSEGAVIAEASWQPGDPDRPPVLVLLHGLEGSARSHYLIGMSRKAYAAGFHTIRVNTRNCGGTEHLTPTLYCAGLSQDVLAIVRAVRSRVRNPRIYAAAVSLGANILLKFLGEQGGNGEHYIRAAGVMSPPIELGLGVRRMQEPQNWIYQRYFVRKLIRRMERKTQLFPHIGDMRRIARVRTIEEFDDVVTAPHFGFRTAENYYYVASSARVLDAVRVPTLIVQAKDDPMIPFDMFLHAGIERNPYLRLLATDYGGHTGFLHGRASAGQDADAYWGESRVVQFLTDIAVANGDLMRRPQHRTGSAAREGAPQADPCP
jgi:predicted alpha/beta-fold hydrolase